MESNTVNSEYLSVLTEGVCLLCFELPPEVIPKAIDKISSIALKGLQGMMA